MKRNIVPMNFTMVHEVAMMIKASMASAGMKVDDNVNVYLFNALKSHERVASSGFSPSLFVMVEDDGNGQEVVGFINIQQTGFSTETFSINEVYVHPSRQKCGIGTELVEFAIRRFRNNGAKICLLSTKIPEYFEQFDFVQMQPNRLDEWKLMCLVFV